MVKSFALLVYALRGPFHGLRFSFRVALYPLPAFLFAGVLSRLSRVAPPMLVGKCRLRASFGHPFSYVLE